MLNFIAGGVCAAQGFRAGGIHVGVKTHNPEKKDMALIVSDVDCACAAVYTKNAVKAAHIHVDKRHLADGRARAAVINSGKRQRLRPQRGGRTPSGSAPPRPRRSAARRRTSWRRPPASSARR